jgi:regulator of replication initiation timing
MSGSERLTAEAEKVGVVGWCDACGGTGTPISGRPCMCGGTGLASDAVHTLRKCLYDAERERDALRAEVDRLTRENERLSNDNINLHDTAREMERAVATARAEAIEQCARVCDEEARAYRDLVTACRQVGNAIGVDKCDAAATAADRLAARFRAIAAPVESQEHRVGDVWEGPKGAKRQTVAVDRRARVRLAFLDEPSCGGETHTVDTWEACGWRRVSRGEGAR